MGCQGPIDARIGLFGQPVPHTWSYRGPILPRFARNLTLEHALMAAIWSWVGCQGPLEGRILAMSEFYPSILAKNHRMLMAAIGPLVSCQGPIEARIFCAACSTPSNRS